MRSEAACLLLPFDVPYVRPASAPQGPMRDSNCPDHLLARPATTGLFRHPRARYGGQSGMSDTLLPPQAVQVKRRTRARSGKRVSAGTASASKLTTPKCPHWRSTQKTRNPGGRGAKIVRSHDDTAQEKTPVPTDAPDAFSAKEGDRGMGGALHPGEHSRGRGGFFVREGALRVGQKYGHGADTKKKLLASARADSVIICFSFVYW